MELYFVKYGSEIKNVWCGNQLSEKGIWHDKKGGRGQWKHVR